MQVELSREQINILIMLLDCHLNLLASTNLTFIDLKNRLIDASEPVDQPLIPAFEMMG